MLSSSSRIGRATRYIGLFMTPEERQRPEVLKYFDNAMIETSRRAAGACDPLRTPHAHALHTALLPNQVLTRRQHHYLQGLMYKVMEDGLETLSCDESHELFSQRSSLRELHGWLWSTVTNEAVDHEERCQDSVPGSRSAT
jgi:membrane glycosyltransferase